MGVGVGSGRGRRGVRERGERVRAPCVLLHLVERAARRARRCRVRDDRVLTRRELARGLEVRAGGQVGGLRAETESAFNIISILTRPQLQPRVGDERNGDDGDQSSPLHNGRRAPSCPPQHRHARGPAPFAISKRDTQARTRGGRDRDRRAPARRDRGAIAALPPTRHARVLRGLRPPSPVASRHACRPPAVPAHPRSRCASRACPVLSRPLALARPPPCARIGSP